MFWRSLYIAGLVLAGLGAAGCLNSEADFQALLEENNTLGEELAEARQENEILAKALEDIKREQEELQRLLNAGKSNLNAGRIGRPASASAPGRDQAQAAGGDHWEDEWQTPQDPANAPAPAASNRYYVAKPGDVLSSVARANRTSVARLLELNPSLRNRRNYIIYANERLRLP